MNRLVSLLVFVGLIMLVPLAMADSVDYVSGGQKPDVLVMGSVAAGKTWSVTDDLTQINNLTTGHDTTGAELGTVDITSGTLFSCATGLCFKGGSVMVKTEAGKMVFTGKFITGTISMSGGNVFLNANLKNGGTAEIMTKHGVFSSNTAVSTSVVPEPASFILLGTGLMGILGYNWRNRGSHASSA